MPGILIDNSFIVKCKILYSWEFKIASAFIQFYKVFNKSKNPNVQLGIHNFIGTPSHFQKYVPEIMSPKNKIRTEAKSRFRLYMTQPKRLGRIHVESRCAVSWSICVREFCANRNDVNYRVIFRIKMSKMRSEMHM